MDDRKNVCECCTRCKRKKIKIKLKRCGGPVDPLMLPKKRAQPGRAALLSLWPPPTFQVQPVTLTRRKQLPVRTLEGWAVTASVSKQNHLNIKQVSRGWSWVLQIKERKMGSTHYDIFSLETQPSKEADPEMGLFIRFPCATLRRKCQLCLPIMI